MNITENPLVFKLLPRHSFGFYRNQRGKYYHLSILHQKENAMEESHVKQLVN